MAIKLQCVFSFVWYHRVLRFSIFISNSVVHYKKQV
jgi:hypothetical protein